MPGGLCIIVPTLGVGMHPRTPVPSLVEGLCVPDQLAPQGAGGIPTETVGTIIKGGEPPASSTSK
jgi:hypothetical protein